MNTEAIERVLASVLPMSEQQGNAEKKKTILGTSHIGNLSGNRLNSGTLRSQFIICESESDWINSAKNARKALHSDQRVFVQTDDDVWDIYAGETLDSESNEPIVLAQGQPGLAALLSEAKKELLDPQPPPANAASGGGLSLSSFVSSFASAVAGANFKYDKDFIKRFIAALLAKPFVILTGLSGSGKTKLAEAFASWLGTRFVEGDGTAGSRHLLVPIGADWSNNEHLLGYPDALHEGTYVLPDSKVLQFILAAKENPNDPYFLILDEMNLSHVERYFADFLSAMESSERTLHLHGVAAGLKAGVSKNSTDAAEKPEADDDKSDKLIIPADLELPDNLFVIGTMNVDETTYMVSPKVLDRAQTLEFRVSHEDIDGFLSGSPAVDMDKLKDGSGKPLGESFAAPFLTLAKGRAGRKPSASFATDLNASLLAAFDKLAELGAEFAFRSTAEIVSFVAFAEEAGLVSDQAIDAAILQKLLPKVHGSRRKLERPLGALWDVCRKDGKTTLQETRDQFGKPFYEGCCRFPWSGEKIARMYRQTVDNGFASFAEA